MASPLRIPIGVLSLLLALAIGGCSSNNSPSADSGGDDQDCWPLGICTGRADSGQDSGVSDSSVSDSSAGDSTVPLLPDGPEPAADAHQPDAATPGCGTLSCPEGTVCYLGTCTSTGPTRACSAAKYPGGLPANQGIFYVDGSYAGTGDGSQAKPYRTISEALKRIPANHKYTVAVAAGDYDESPLIGSREDSAITFGADLYCACPEQVHIRQPIRMVAGAALNVVVDGCSVVPKAYDTCQWPSCPGPVGIEAKGSSYQLHVLVRDSVVAGWCAGLSFSADNKALLDASLCLARSRITGNHRGVDVASAPVLKQGQSPFAECQDLDENVALVLNRIDHSRDHAVFTHDYARGIAMRGNLVEASGELCGVRAGAGFGVYLGDTDSASLEGNLIRHNANRGIGMRNQAASVSLGINIANNVLTSNSGAGIALQKMQALVAIQVTGNQVFNTAALPGEPGGDGIQVSVDQASSYVVNIGNNLVSGSQRDGLFYDGVGGTVESNTITSSGQYGCLLQQSSATVDTNNTWGDNSAGDVHNYISPVQKYGGLPVPIP